ncbi:TPR-like protein [Calocera viscosa TUFC12733]|uniref:TPR-like protein n=1 Tax=Calocera viscosa (strain TUFC12733) TaxID=1330018 RepID=A0A167HCU9_CALVF|nr:TPR-like protein [Calocera viscosa TUFC12733]
MYKRTIRGNCVWGENSRSLTAYSRHDNGGGPLSHVTQSEMLAVELDAPASMSKSQPDRDELQSGLGSDLEPEDLSPVISWPAKPPSTLPPCPQHFYGRDDEFEVIAKQLVREESCRIALLGPGGIGKTTLAVALAHDPRVQAKYGRYILFLNCDGLPTPEIILRALAASLRLGSSPNDVQRALNYLGSLGVPVLLVLDSLECVWDTVHQESVEDYLNQLSDMSHLSLLVTMRGTLRPSRVDWTLPVAEPLQPVDLHAARQIFVNISRRVEPTGDVDTLLELLDGLPLAITLMAFQAQILTAQELLRAYYKEKTRLLRRGRNRRLTSMDVSIEASLHSRTIQKLPEAVPVLSIICLLPNGINRTRLENALPSLQKVTEIVDALQQVALVVEDPERLGVLAPVRAVILERYPPYGAYLQEIRHYFMRLTEITDILGDEATESVMEVLREHFDNLISVLVHFWRAYPGSDEVEKLFHATQRVAEWSCRTTYGDPTPLLMAAHTRLDEMHRHREAAICAQRLGKVLQLQIRYQDAVSMLEKAKAEFIVIGAPLGEAQCLHSLGSLLCIQLRYQESIPMFEEAQRAFETIKDSRGSAQCMQSIGDALRMQFRYGEAIPMLEKANAAFRAINERLGQAQCIQSHGDLLRMQSRYRDAVALLEEAKLAFEDIGELLGVAQCTQSLGDVLRMQSRFEDSIVVLEKAKAVFETIGESLGVAQCTRSIGDALCMQSRYDDAVPILWSAKGVFEAIDERLGAAQCTQSLGDILYMRSQYEEAAPMLREAEAAFQVIGEPLGAAQCMQSLGDILRMQSRYQEAALMLERAKTAFQTMNEPRGHAQCLQSLADILYKQFDYRKAVPLFEEARVAFDEIGEQLGAAQCTRSLGDAWRVQFRYDAAVIMLEKAKSQFEVVGSRLGIAQCLQSLGDVFRMRQQYQEAAVVLQKAAIEFESVGDPLGVARCKQNLADVLRRQPQGAVLTVEDLITRLTTRGIAWDVTDSMRTPDKVDRLQFRPAEDSMDSLPVAISNDHEDDASNVHPSAPLQSASDRGELHEDVIRRQYSAAQTLPLEPERLVGRAVVIDQLINGITSGDVPHFAVCGPPGIGKTTVARALVHNPRIAQKFGSNRWFLDCDGVTSADGIISSLTTCITPT